MWLWQLILGRQRLRRSDLPRSPKIYSNPQTGTVVVTGKHATELRCLLTSGLLGLVQRGGIVAIILFGACLLPESDGQLNALQRWRVQLDQAIFEHLPAAVTSTFMRGPVLWDWVYAIVLGIFIGAMQFLRITNRELLSGYVLGKRSTVKFSKNAVTRYAFGLFPLTYRQEGGIKIRFRAAEDPTTLNQNRPLNDQAVVLEMIIGTKCVPIARMLGMPLAQQFASACDAALVLARELDRPRSQSARRTLMPANARALE